MLQGSSNGSKAGGGLGREKAGTCALESHVQLRVSNKVWEQILKESSKMWEHMLQEQTYLYEEGLEKEGGMAV
jgi:hypothetical protein